jgi:hypothetical protein
MVYPSMVFDTSYVGICNTPSKRICYNKVEFSTDGLLSRHVRQSSSSSRSLGDYEMPAFASQLQGCFYQRQVRAI